VIEMAFPTLNSMLARFKKKESQTMRAILAMFLGNAAWSNTDNYETMAREGYKQNVVVFSCINLIARSCAGIPWIVYKKGKEKNEEIENHPLVNLIHRPNPRQGQSRFFDSMVGYYMLTGNSYIERVGPASGAPKELYPLRPDRVEIILGNEQQPILRYDYKVGAKIVPLEPELILHLKSFNPLDDWYGMAPLTAASRAVDQNNSSKEWNVALLQNAAMPSGALVTQQNLADEQYDQLRKEIDTKYAGAKHAGRPMLFEGGLDWRQMAISPVDMAWLEGLKFSGREIAIAFGVPPELIGDNSNKTYSNYGEARMAFYLETVLPLMDFLRDELNNWLTPLYGDSYYLDYDRDEIEAIQEDRKEVWSRANKSFASGLLTKNEAREMIGYESVEGGDEFKEANSGGQEEETDPGEEQGEAEETGEGDEEAETKALKKKHKAGEMIGDEEQVYWY
jgi:HK97 family phage portal protein